MAYPPSYERDFSFTEFETLNPGQPKPGAALDTEFDDVSNALTATQDALALIQRDDGKLANDSVGEDQLQDDVFDGIVDGITAEAEAARDAAAASASAAAASATAADTSANTALTQAGLAAGSAALAGSSQTIAQDAANEAALSAAAADASADEAELAANTTAGSVAEAQMSAELAFKWAEYLAGPVEPAPPGWPEAVDDGMFSSKWWAIRSRDYNTVTHIDLGTGQTDIGAAFEEWLAIPGNEQPLGLIYATWGTPPLEYALTDPSNPTDPDSWTLISGGPGPAGPPNTLTIGTVTTGSPGTSASAVITGVSPNQVLSLTIPRGDVGATGGPGPAGPPNTLAIGTVTTGAAGSPADATITGVSPNQTLNLVIPQGIQGIQGIPGPQGNPGVTTFANPTALLGLAAINGVATTAMRSDASPALSQAIAPTWTAQHIYSKAGTAGACAIRINAAGGAGINFSNTLAPANKRQWDVVAGDDGRMYFRANTDAGGDGAAYMIVTRTDAATFSNVQFETEVRVTQSGGPTADSIKMVSATPLIAWVSLGSAVDEKRWDIYAGGKYLVFRATNDANTTPTNWLAVERTGIVINSVRFTATTVSSSGNFHAIGGDLYLANQQALTNQSDGYLRLNATEQFLNGVYTPGKLRSATWLQGDTGLGNADLSKTLTWETGALFGTVVVAGAAFNGYTALSLRDYSLNPVFMSNGANAGLYCQGDAKWMLYRTSITDMHSQYILNAISFNTTSSRKIKRETGKPTRAADILSRLRPILYRLLADEDSEQLGMIAEEVHDVCPQLSNGKSISYDRLAILLLADWQEKNVVA